MSSGSIPEAIEAFSRGEFLIVVDDADRENEGDLVIAAEKVTADKIAFMVRYTSGLICVPTTAERLRDLSIPQMVTVATDNHDTAFTISVDYRHGTTTGISAADRAATIRALADPNVAADDFARPGHIFPLRAMPGGVLQRPGHTEAAVDLARLAGLHPTGAVCEVVSDHGNMALADELSNFAAEHNILMVSISDLIDHRVATNDLAPPAVRRMTVEAAAVAVFPTKNGEFQIAGYRTGDDTEIVALIKGNVEADGVLVRVHSECVTGDALGSMRCDCRDQLEQSMKVVEAEGSGVVLYMRGHEGRGIGLLPKLAAYALQDSGFDTVEANEELGLPADSRDYGAAAAVLADLGVRSVRLLTNNPEKQANLENHGVPVKERVPLRTSLNDTNHDYLRAKVDKMGHLLDLDREQES
ncbi:MAG: bifunctional 3,4-dihydroxy-2-butanone-4-phosphate synthase/GTP cyclohydrolase II [Acidimicrobiia bacterium]|nr:bifunctional 3,4-dihydroxy-2-butanone-4-phosphate synthase/GTP cyclohydrolase II [Acidimicrobiia bacterium]MDH3469759.1 bifunctional 3,4-dihydroxy-2-butanone-4-phosphate synthase/GTP cyclohydrolase II [Acidimicrobiia bacterium]